ncbi:hypothetical protein ACFE04_026928 [Oxalis oulophora]
MALLHNQLSHGPSYYYYYYDYMRTTSDVSVWEQNMKTEKRRLFLRSYQFSRKKSLKEKIKTTLSKAKKVIWVKLKSARKIRKFVWSRLRFAFYSHRRKRFLRLLGYGNGNGGYNGRYNSSFMSSNCFW